MTTYAIYTHGVDGPNEPVVVLGYTDLAGQPLPPILLPHERAEDCAYVIVVRNAGAGARHLISSAWVHASELGSCDVVERGFHPDRRELVCLTCSTRTGPGSLLVEGVTA